MQKLVNLYCIMYGVLLLTLASCSDTESIIEGHGNITPGVPAVLKITEADTSKHYLLRLGSKGEALPIQHLKGSKWMVISTDVVDLPAVYSLTVLETSKSDTQPSVKNNTEKLTVYVENSPVITYQKELIIPENAAIYQRGGFIHPAYSPAGQIITDDFPDGHKHQHAIFAAWVNTLFHDRDTDFWNQQDRTGTVLFDSLLYFREGPVFTEFVTRQKHVALVDSDTLQVLEEFWKVRVYNTTDVFIWDIELHQENVADSTLIIEPYHYGGMAIRGSSEWNDTTLSEDQNVVGKGRGGFLTSLGNQRLDGNHTRPDWTSMFGKVDDKDASITMIQHPGNPGYPQYVRIHPKMPYFCYLPIVEKGINLRPGDIYTSVYRIITTSAAPDPAFLNNVATQFGEFPVN